MARVALTRSQVRSVDRIAIEEVGIPGVVLMENAGINATAVILDVLTKECGLDPDESRVAILCGGGNNGGDGYVIARHLHNWGATVTIFAATPPDKLTGDAAINQRVCANLGFDIRMISAGEPLEAHVASWDTHHVVVDALLGTGFEGEVRPHLARVIRAVNALQRPVVVAVDVPSGLDCETGTPSNATVQADVTVTFVETKTGFQTPEAQAYLGRVVVADIGVPLQVVQRAML